MPFNPGNKRAQRARNVPTVGGPMKFGLYPTVGVSLPFLMKLTRCCGPKNAACSGKREAVVACGASVQVCKACNVPLTCPADAPRGSCVSQEDIHKQVYPVVKGDCGSSGFAPRYCRDCCNKVGKGPGNGLADVEAFVELQSSLLSQQQVRFNDATKDAQSRFNAAQAAMINLAIGIVYADGPDQPPTIFDLSGAQKQEAVEKVIKETKNKVSAQVKGAQDLQEDIFATVGSYVDNFAQEAKALLSDRDKAFAADIAEAQRQLAETLAEQVNDKEGLEFKEKRVKNIQDAIKDLTANRKANKDKFSDMINSLQQISDSIARESLEMSLTFRNMNQAVAALGAGFKLTGNDKRDAQDLKKAGVELKDELTAAQEEAMTRTASLMKDIEGLIIDSDLANSSEFGNTEDALKDTLGSAVKPGFFVASGASLMGFLAGEFTAIAKNAFSEVNSGDGNPALEAARQALDNYAPGGLNGASADNLFAAGFGVETWQYLFEFGLMDDTTYSNVVAELDAKAVKDAGGAGD